MFDTQTRKSFCLLLAIVLILNLIPMSVLATDGIDSNVPEEIIDTIVYINGQDVTTIDEGDDTISWDAETKTLTLNNASILAENGTHKGSGIYVVGNDTVVLELQGESTVEGKSNGDVYDIFANAAISTVGDLIIRGEGTLNATDLPMEWGRHGISAGIYAGGALTIESGTINATGGNSGENTSFSYSAGIISGDYGSWGTMRITGGTVNATGDTYGIVTYTTLLISGGTVNAFVNDEDGRSGIYTPDQYGGYEYGGVIFAGGTTTVSGPVRAVTGLTYFQDYGLYRWANSPDGELHYSGLNSASGMLNKYLRIEPSEYQFVDPDSDNRFTADVLYNNGENWGSLPENVTVEYNWYHYNEQILTGADFDESTVFYATYDEASGLWTAPIVEGDGVAGAIMVIPANVGDIITVTVPQVPLGQFFVLAYPAEKIFEERTSGVFTLTVTEQDLEAGMLALYMLGMEPFQYTVSLTNTEQVQSSADAPNQFIRDLAGRYLCSATVYRDGTALGTFTSAPFDYTYTGWKPVVGDNGEQLGDQYIKDHVPQYTGWTEIEGKWYYLDPETGLRAEGVSRVPYPTAPINGITYAPDAEAMAYYASKGQTFIDAASGWFYFDGNGVFQSNMNHSGSTGYFENGFKVWHPGMVKLADGLYVYYTGDEVNGGNKLVINSDAYVSKNRSDFPMVVGGVYTFDRSGYLCMYDGITDVNGVLRYYENARLMKGNGLTKVGENFIYVNSNGELVVDAQYYISENDLGVAVGTYDFDENGYLMNPLPSEKNGVFFENGAWYYYENGKIGYGKGLIAYGDGYIYVRSSGKLATGDYYITNVSNDTSGLFTLGMKVQFGENGIAAAPRNGIYEVDGALYYFENNQIQYNAGLMEYNGGWIYVRSSGKLASGAYWITNTNGKLDSGFYEFDDNGYMVIDSNKDGIVAEDGKLYYYVNGMKQYGLGLVQLSDGAYIYVRTGGELAVGSYWITNRNGLLSEGMYEFGADGILSIN